MDDPVQFVNYDDGLCKALGLHVSSLYEGRLLIACRYCKRSFIKEIERVPRAELRECIAASRREATCLDQIGERCAAHELAWQEERRKELDYQADSIARAIAENPEVAVALADRIIERLAPALGIELSDESDEEE
jgi:hypothetical protein